MIKSRFWLISTLALFICLTFIAFVPNNRYVKPNGSHFTQFRKPYQLQGCNYWYGGYAAFDSVHHGKERLQHELDFLQQQGINNLRVFLCGEGNGDYAYRIHPALQEKPGKFNPQVLSSFDTFLDEVWRRGMTVVVVLNNNWEWSGGFGQYLEWVTNKKAPLPKTKAWDWDAYCNYISAFYSNEACQRLYRESIKTIINRVNTVNRVAYKKDPCIMAWELANEPRPMKKTAIKSYIQWIEQTSRFIKTLDPNHMVTTGVEGMIGTNQDYELFKQIHQCSTIDYATIHLWPGIWRWYEGGPEYALSDSCSSLVSNYIKQHADIMLELGKPLVLEEFGLQRDGNSFSSMAGVEARDQFYQLVYQEGKKNDVAGYNFWGYAGQAKKDTSSWFWKKGDPYSADPPQEQQGLFSVFEQDQSTWNIIADQEEGKE